MYVAWFKQDVDGEAAVHLKRLSKRDSTTKVNWSFSAHEWILYCIYLQHEDILALLQRRNWDKIVQSALTFAAEGTCSFKGNF